MILFAISFFLVFISSYFLTSVIAPKKSILGLIYLFLIAFAQIIITLEFLSLFTAIKVPFVLSLNLLFFIVFGLIWNKKSRPLWSLDCRDFLRRVLNAFKLDKTLIVLFVGFCVFFFGALILCVLMPITNADAQGYHVARSLFWVLQGSLNHFDTAEIRALCLPINSEILYSWIILFVKKDVFLGFFSFVGYLLSIISVYNICGYLGFCTRRRLWIIFILSSFSSVLVQASGTETDIIIAGLVSSSIFMFWYALKHNKMTPVFMASLAYAIAAGTKTPSLMAIPAVGLFMLVLCIIYKKFKPMAWFLGFGLINFIIFSSYNYILNYIQFSDFMGSQSFMLVSKNYYGIKAIPANFIKYIFMFFDFTGFTWSDYIGTDILDFRNSILLALHLGSVKEGLYTTGYDIQRTLIEPMMGAGILGFLVYLPCLAWSFIRPIFKRKSKKTLFNLGFACIFIINLLVMSYLIAFMTFSVRFFMFFMVISSPILFYSYFSNKNPLKYVIIAFALFYLTCVSTHLWPRPLHKIIRIFKSSHSITDLRFRAICTDFEKDQTYRTSTCLLKFKIEHDYAKGSRILVFMNSGDDVYILKALEFDGYKIDTSTMEDAHKINFNNYNLVISSSQGQTSTLVKYYPKRKNECVLRGTKLSIAPGATVPCLYIPNIMIPNPKNGGSKPPFEVHCAMSQNFLTEKNLYLIGETGVINEKQNEMAYYTIYQNKNLPLHYNIQPKVTIINSN